MSQPPQGEDPRDGGWGPPSGGPGPGGGWGAPPGGPYGQHPAPGGYGQPGGWGPPSQHGAPGQHGSPYGQPGSYGAPGPYGGQYGAPTGYEQPAQYGGWGQPPQPVRRRRRFGKVFWLLVFALVLGLAVTLPARLGGTRLDPQAVERDVAAQYQQREGVGIDVRCDQPMTVQDGRTYTCDGTTADDRQVTLTITITSADGDYTWSDS
jgi:Domain of unknown function (DUF4333)